MASGSNAKSSAAPLAAAAPAGPAPEGVGMSPQRRLALLADALAADTKFKTIKYRQGVQTTEGFTNYRGTTIRVGDKDISKLTHAQYKAIRNQCSEVFRDSRQDGSARRLLKKHLGPLLTHFHFDWVQGQPLRNILRLKFVGRTSVWDNPVFLS